MLLRDLPDEWTFRNEGADTFTPFDVVGHLIHAERTNWMPRARMVLQSGEAETFEPFDRLGHLESESKSLGFVLDEFARLRTDNLRELRGWNLRRDHLIRRGLHPALGAVTLGELLATWAAHDLDHLHQIARTMAYQYRDAVGPWRGYLGVMRCEAHGDA
ncbi:MAG: DinB family protein [Ignavibacteriota bacterium]